MSFTMEPHPPVPPMPDYAPGVTPPKPKKNLWVIIGVSVAAFLVLFAIFAIVSINVVAANQKAAVIKSAVESCDLTHKAGFDLGDKDRTLTIDTKGKEDLTGASLADAGCVLKALNVSDKAMSHMTSTRALDGRQTDTWEGIDAAWSYHPDSGMSMTLSIADEKK